MASYVESVLADGERVVYRARISQWLYLFHYILGGVFTLAGLVSPLATRISGDHPVLVATVLMLIGAGVLAVAVIERLSTELVLTNRRVITKRGFISRDTVEMNLAKVESFRVNQGLLGRILNYGDVTIVGTGSSPEPLHGIANPIELRRRIGEVLPEVTSER